MGWVGAHEWDGWALMSGMGVHRGAPVNDALRGSSRSAGCERSASLRLFEPGQQGVEALSRANP